MMTFLPLTPYLTVFLGGKRLHQIKLKQYRGKGRENGWSGGRIGVGKTG